MTASVAEVASRAPARPDARVRIDRLLFARFRAGEPRARDALAERFLPLARSLARRYSGAGEPLDDLIQVASLGLLKAIDRYDPTRGCTFSTYAVPTIVGELKRYFRDRTWAVRPPRAVQELALRIERARTQLDGAPPVAELAAATGNDEQQVLQALQAQRGRGALSLDVPRSDDRTRPALAELIASDDELARAEARVLLDRACVGLSARAREILRLRFVEDMTQQQIGDLFGVSQMQISRIIRQTIDHCHRLLTSTPRCSPATERTRPPIAAHPGRASATTGSR